MNPTPPNRYAELVALDHEAGRLPKPVSKITIELPHVQAAQLARLALHLNRSPAEIVADALGEFLVALPQRVL
jgi:hypothetical protein